MMTRVAHVFPTDRVAYLMRSRLMRLQEKGFCISVLCGDRGYTERLRQCGLNVVTIPFAREISPVVDIQCIWSLRAALRRGQYAIAHSHNPKGTLLGPVSAQWAGSTVVIHTVHGFLFNEYSRGFYRIAALAAERWCAFWSDHLLFQSEEDYEYAKKKIFKNSDRLHLIGNGVDERRFDQDNYPEARQKKRFELGFSENHFVVGMVTRLVREKGCIDFFAAASIICQRYENARFLLVGIPENTDQKDAVDPVELAKEYRIVDKCVLLEDRLDMPELYLSMDLCVLPSYREGLPRCLLEAAVMGIPTVATRIRGCKEIIVDGETGLLYPPGNVNEFVAVIDSLINDEILRKRISKEGVLRVKANYTEAHVTERIVRLYQSVVPDS
ncbi:MAG: glycosyltransferase family 4 protein [Candidatus Latescibacterota bacterium]|nr:glycosyltransferase family 4 protein [Candidatus Latescibacterota bacterium]